MRFLRVLVVSSLVAALWPASSFAQTYSAARGAASTRAAVVPGLSPGLAPGPLPLASVSSPSPLMSPSLSALGAPAPIPASAPSVLRPAAAPILPKAADPSRSVFLAAAAARSLSLSIKDVPLAAAPQAAAESFSLLTGEVPASAAALSEAVRPAASAPDFRPNLAPPSAPLPPAPGPEAVKHVRRMMIGTSVMKSGMETITLSVPLLALAAFGGISAVAGLVVVYGLSQAVFAGMAGGLSDRYSARKVLAGAVTAQAVLVSALIAVGAAGALTMGTMIPLYLLIGGVTGVIETTRHSIPALILGRDEAALTNYNAKLHIWYEVAGVAGALTAGALIGLIGPLWSLAIQPPAYALAAWYFWRVKHAAPPAQAAAGTGAAAKIKAYFADLKAGAGLVLGDVRLRWVALAFVLPQIVHRVFENLLIPVFAKKVLENPSASAWLLTASNAGELAGAAVLLRLAARFPGASGWVRWGALGLLLIWTLAFSHSLTVLLPLILLSSLTWAASDLSLRSEVQRSVSGQNQPRALAFLYGAFVLGSALSSLALGGLIDALTVGPALYWICGAFTALALGVYYASRRLK